VFEVVVATPDVVGERMAGPGIRVTYFARELAKIPGVNVTIVDRDGPREAFRRADVLIGQPARGFFKRKRGQKVVYDLFDPMVLELRELYGAAPSLRQRVHLAAEWTRLQFALAHADLLICAASQQRDFYAQLQWSDVPWIEVPFGIDISEVKKCPPVHDNIVVWGGGVWEWLDPKTAIDAVVALNRDGFRCRLLFLGRTAARGPFFAPPRERRALRRRQPGVGAVSRAIVVVARWESRYHAPPPDGGGELRDPNQTLRCDRDGSPGRRDREGIRSGTRGA
jgi:hypothetical protein